MSTNYKFFILSFLCFLGVNAQKTDAFYQYSISPALTQIYAKSRVQPINGREHYWILNPTPGIDTIKSIRMVGSSKPNSPYTVNVNSNEKSPNMIFLMNKDKITWNMLLIPIRGGRGLNIINSQLVGEDMFLYCTISADSLKIQVNQGKSTYLNVPDSSIYILLKISKSGTCAIENYFMPLSRLQSRLIAINEKSYTVYFPISRTTDWYKTNLDKTLVNNMVADSLLSGILMQFDIGNNKVKNWISGTLPILEDNRGDFSYISTSNKLFLPGRYHGNVITIKNYSPFSPAIKINSNPLIYFKKPITFSLNNTYLYWTLIDLDKWSVDEMQFNLIKGDQTYWYINNYGVLKSGYWFQTYSLYEIATDKLIPSWQKISGSASNLFTYNKQIKDFHTTGFPDYIQYVEQDGDSLLFVAGGTLNMPGPSFIDFDNSDSFHYNISKGFYCSEYTPQGKIVWARYGNVILNESRIDRYKSSGGGRVLTSTQSYLSDLDFGFKHGRKTYVGDNSGFVMQLSKAPICDFDIENIDNNHVTLNYKGALNANFYYKYGDGSKDSNMNQRYFVHDYRKTGSFLLYCIAKNAYGSDTAYYSLDIWDIVSAKKLTKDNRIVLSPNPTKGQIHWDIDNVTSIDIYNNNGQLVLREKTEGNSLNIEQLPTAMYTVVVHTETDSFCNKVVKE
jgi:hypothetical protein